jgi:hypothetical protein
MLRAIAAVTASVLAAAALSVGAALAETQPRHEVPQNAKKAAGKAAFWCPLHLEDEK